METLKHLWWWSIARLNEPSTYHGIGLAVAIGAYLLHKATFDEAIHAIIER